MECSRRVMTSQKVDWRNALGPLVTGRRLDRVD